MSFDLESLDEKRFQDNTGIDSQTLERFKVWRAALIKANEHTNLVGRSSLDSFWLRHAYDSWQVYALSPKTKTWVDLGSGAGFPGLAIAFCIQGQCDDSKIYLIEAKIKKAQFLQNVSRETSAPTYIINKRIEDLLSPPKVGVVTARALAPLYKLLNYVRPFMTKETVALLPKGERYQQELDEARKKWKFDCDVHPSKTNFCSKILQIRNLSILNGK